MHSCKRYDQYVRKRKRYSKESGITTISTVLITTFVYLFIGLKALAGLFGVGEL
ncbi:MULTISPECIES: hypothetical protein [unclassified Peribacillus]|uniref:hypothetical protein n=1 Tax=unclassified Peribacillus TaxID=2675266 RepID=UPI003672BA0F